LLKKGSAAFSQNIVWKGVTLKCGNQPRCILPRQLPTPKSADISLTIVEADIEDVAPIMRSSSGRARRSVGMQRTKINIPDRQQLVARALGQEGS